MKEKLYIMKLVLYVILSLLGVYLLILIVATILVNRNGRQRHQIKTYYTSSRNIESAKQRGSFLWEYEPVSIHYKTIVFCVEAFAEHPFDTISSPRKTIINERDAYLQVRYRDEGDMREINYGKDWIIDDKEYIARTNFMIYHKYFDYELPKDTLTFFIRERHLELDCNRYHSESDFQWDTLCSFQMVRK